MLRIATLLTGGILVLGLLCGPAAATQGGNNNDNRGGGGRDINENFLREFLDLRLPGNRAEKIVEIFVTKLGQRRQEAGGDDTGSVPQLGQQVMIETRMVEVTNVDKIDLFGVPFLGGLAGPEFNADDLDEDSQVGNVFFTGNNGLFVVLEPTALGNPGVLNLNRLLVFNGDYSPEVKPLELDRTPEPAEFEQGLGQLASVPSVRSITTQVTVPDGGTVLLGGFKRDTAATGEGQVPFFGDLPVLGGLFAGTAHQDGRSNLLILIKPSIVVPSEGD